MAIYTAATPLNTMVSIATTLPLRARDDGEQQHQQIEQDEVLPVFAFDDTALNRIMNVTGLLRYDAVLDAGKLRDSLASLLHTGGWRKLRGRLRLDDQDKLCIAVPRTSSSSTRYRPALRFRQTVLGQRIATHPLASRLAQHRTRSSVQEAIAGFSSSASASLSPNPNPGKGSRKILDFLVPPDWPRTLAEYVDPDRDEPVLGLHVLSFTDATIVVLGFSHVLMDGGGLEALLGSWAGVLNSGCYGADGSSSTSSTSSSRTWREGAEAPGGTGGVGAVPDLAIDDPLDVVRAQLSSNTSPPAVEKSVLHDKIINLANLMPEESSSASAPAPAVDPHWDTTHPGSRWRTVSFSPTALRSITAEARTGLTSEDLFVSEDDAVTAWLVRACARAEYYPADRPLNVMRLYDMRGRLPDVFASCPTSSSAGSTPGGKVYVQNAYQMAWTLFPGAGPTSGDRRSRIEQEGDPSMMTMTLADVATALRASLTEQTTPGQVVASMAARMAIDGGTPLYGDPRGAFTTLNSWVRMKLYERADFSGAVLLPSFRGAEDSDASSGEEEEDDDGEDEDEEAYKRRKGRPEFIDFDFSLGGAPPGPNFITSGKHPRTGVRYAMGYLAGAMWERFEAELEKLG
ncbi:hypothetical protein Micbo1qcDRAFT_198236 [Microdochium bolleyi]|uniref:Transferase family-domain-containing protein n=1 Tax=Microdochium bolleyi TaxID=196109 RepID=A0A136INL7_9PEZI|nr:hypothetical protein Micbo1qcDRAFT_198236 [Microdochium bolleyi]